MTPVIPHYATGVWSLEDGAWSFQTTYLGDDRSAARRALSALWRRLPEGTAKWAVYILDQRTMEILYE